MKDIIYINKVSGALVDKNYPNAEPYIRKSIYDELMEKNEEALDRLDAAGMHITSLQGLVKSLRTEEYDPHERSPLERPKTILNN